MESIINLEGWQLFWTISALGIIGGSALTGLGALVMWVEMLGEERGERE